MERKYFTIEAAQKLLPKIQSLIIQLQQLQAGVDLINQVYIDPDKTSYEDYMSMDTQLSKKFHKLSYDFYCELEKFDKMGILIKDLDKGLVDFYTKFEGRDIFLCWQFGEEKIQFWHEIDEGFEGRQQIIDLGEIKKEN
ncbi:MAG: DUF2203 domain-containing protein [Candidatus Woesearchaeota archaeon]|jgi:hypothetical protein|nr:DUF2203 domain-containing protein [Candidatus Woesearchaeota archaeon]MDP7458298.1 DUF2203 domain-containing protein [Candidatus Woesearchaeota archaeon]|tara:strand:- start:398 stop:814 length:417 start_codon:yes stop_codon:yes gene_type:complete